MSLKQIIREQKILQSGAVDMELELPGEPMIYSIKYAVGQRKRGLQFFRNRRWYSLLRCFFRAYMKTSTPVVIIVRFYVTPPESENINAAALKKECIPATFAYELADYYLSFIEMLHHVLINSYRQIVKTDIEKFYSNNPRTVMQFMSWDHYVKLKNNYTNDPASQSVSQTFRA